MKRVIFYVIFIFTGVFSVNAQNNNVRLFEFEFGGGISTSGKATTDLGYKSDNTEIGVNLFIEARVNIPNSAFDVSAQLWKGYFTRDWNDLKSVQYNSINFAVYTDYNFWNT